MNTKDFTNTIAIFNKAMGIETKINEIPYFSKEVNHTKESSMVSRTSYILRNGDGSEAIIPADLLPESQRDNGGCIDAVEAVKHLVEIIRKYEQENKDLWQDFRDAAEFEARVAKTLATERAFLDAYGACYINTGMKCPNLSCSECRIKYARIIVEEEMENARQKHA